MLCNARRSLYKCEHVKKAQNNVKKHRLHVSKVGVKRVTALPDEHLLLRKTFINDEAYVHALRSYYHIFLMIISWSIIHRCIGRYLKKQGVCANHMRLHHPIPGGLFVSLDTYRSLQGRRESKNLLQMKCKCWSSQRCSRKIPTRIVLNILKSLFYLPHGLHSHKNRGYPTIDNTFFSHRQKCRLCCMVSF